jgi:hypothetical protein
VLQSQETIDQNAYRWAELMRLVGLRENVFAEDEQMDALLLGGSDACGCDRCRPAGVAPLGV